MRALIPSRIEDVGAMACHLRFEHAVAAPAARVFQILASGENQRQWAEGYRRTRWYGPQREAGAVRDIHMRWITVRERFLIWQPGARFTFTCDAMSVPLTRCLIEDIEFSDVSADASRLLWSVHFTPATALRWAAGIARIEASFRPMFAGFATGLASYASLHPRG
jgi:hypothetical protein